MYHHHFITVFFLAPGSTRPPGDIGPEYPVVRSFALGTRPSSGPVVHREPPKKMHTQNMQQRNDVTKPVNRYPAARQVGRPVQKEPEKPSATNLYEDHMKKRQFVSHIHINYDMRVVVNRNSCKSLGS